MTAFVHSIMVQKRRGMFRMWNMALIITAFTMAQMGMFINRGGTRSVGALIRAKHDGLAVPRVHGGNSAGVPSPYSCGDTTR